MHKTHDDLLDIEIILNKKLARFIIFYQCENKKEVSYSCLLQIFAIFVF